LFAVNHHFLRAKTSPYILEKTLKKQVIGGVAWRGSADIIQQVLQIVFTIVLARLLTKADFGLLATAMVINRFFVALISVGFGGAIIRSTDITKEQISAIFYIQLILNFTLSVVVYYLAQPIASFFEEIELVRLVEITAWIILLQTFQFPTILLRKNMQFKSFSLIEISSMLIANTAAIIMAFDGFGIWSLVARLFIQKLCFVIGTWFAAKWKPTKPDFNGLKPIMNFGFNMLGSNLLSYFSENLIAIIISKFLGKEIMGLFNIAYNLAIVPASKIKSVLLSVLTPGFAKIQLDIISFTKNNRKVLLYLSLTFIPFMFLMSGMSENIVLFMYGAKWIDASPMLLILAIVGLMKGVVHLLRSSILVKGEARVILYATIIELVSSLPLMYFYVSIYGVNGLLIGYSVGTLTSFFYIVYKYDKLFEEKIFYKTVLLPFIFGVSLFALVFFIGQFSINLYIELILQLFMALILFGILMRLFYWKIMKKALQRFKLLKNRA